MKYIYKNIDEAEQACKENCAVKIVNLKQIGFYAKYDCQPDFIWQGYDNKLVAYYAKTSTIHAWRMWSENKSKDGEK